MSPLFYVAAGLLLGGIAATVYAFLSTPDGFEDERGFHEIEPSVKPNPHTPFDEQTDEDENIPPVLPAH